MTRSCTTALDENLMDVFDLRPGGVAGYPCACYYYTSQFRESPRVHTRINS